MGESPDVGPPSERKDLGEFEHGSEGDPGLQKGGGGQGMRLRTFTDQELIFWACRMRQDVVGLDHGGNVPTRKSRIVGSLRRVPRRRRKNTVKTVAKVRKKFLDLH